MVGVRRRALADLQAAGGLFRRVRLIPVARLMPAGAVDSGWRNRMLYRCAVIRHAAGTR
jgi:hypothetical protein